MASTLRFRILLAVPIIHGLLVCLAYGQLVIPEIALPLPGTQLASATERTLANNGFEAHEPAIVEEAQWATELKPMAGKSGVFKSP